MRQKTESIIIRTVGAKSEQIDKLTDLCHKAKNLYNYANYCVRQSFVNTGKIPSEFSMTGDFGKNDQVDYRALPAQSSQQIVRLLHKDWKSFFAACGSYKKDPSSFTGRPKLPKYKPKNGLHIMLFTYQQIRLIDSYLHFPKALELKPVKLRPNIQNIKQVRIIPRDTYFRIEVVYEYEGKFDENIAKLKEQNRHRYASIDLGVSNLATLYNDADKQSIIISGRTLKAINQKHNKYRAKYASLSKCSNTKRLKRLNHNHEMALKDYLHKASKQIVDYCQQHCITDLVIGYNKGWQNGSNMGRRNNQNFCMMPFSQFIRMVRQKAENIGISVVETEESYTSKVDHFALESMEHHEQYLGKRICRGLFKSSTNVVLNADVNGAIGVLRKVIGNEFLTKFGTDRGHVCCPVRLANINQKAIDAVCLTKFDVNKVNINCQSIVNNVNSF